MSEFHRDHPERAFTNDDPWMAHRSFRVAAGLEGRESGDEDVAPLRHRFFPDRAYCRVCGHAKAALVGNHRLHVCSGRFGVLARIDGEPS